VGEEVKRMKLGSLFDGSGGFPLAGALNGIEPVWASEVEPYPIAVTTSRFPYMKHLGDVSKVNGAEIEPVDIITFGSPCQDMSVAGKRAGIKHDDHGDEETTRSGLFYEAIRIIKEMRYGTEGRSPTIIVWENVPGAFSSNRGEDFRTVLEELVKIAEPTAVVPDVPQGGWAYADCWRGDGWSLAYRVFDAQHIRTAQRRKRIYLVLCLGDEDGAGKILFKRDRLRGHYPQSGKAWERTASPAEGSLDADDREGTVGADPYNGCVTEGHVNAGDNQMATAYAVENHPADSRVNIDESGTVQTLTSRMGTGGGNVPMVIEPFCKSRRAQSADDATTWKHGDKANTLNTFDLGETRVNELVVEVGNGQVHDAVTPNKEVSKTLNCMVDPMKVCIINPVRYIVRRLTPTECARLQGFPDRWGDIDHKETMTNEDYAFWLEVRQTYDRINGRAKKYYTEKQILTWYNKLHNDGAEYKMWGNGIALPCALFVMEGIVEVAT
jgi:DNA (cytosine-5)-methyltransferase 1